MRSFDEEIARHLQQAAASGEVEMFQQRASLAAQVRDCTDPQTRAELLRQLSELEQKIALRLEALRAYCQGL